MKLSILFVDDDVNLLRGLRDRSGRLIFSEGTAESGLAGHDVTLAIDQNRVAVGAARQGEFDLRHDRMVARRGARHLAAGD